MKPKNYKIRYVKKGKKGYSKFTGKGQYKRVVTLGNKVVGKDKSFYNFQSEANLSRAINKFDLPRQRFRDKKGRFTTAQHAFKTDIIESGKKIFTVRSDEDFFTKYVFGTEDHIFIGHGEDNLITHVMGKYLAEFSERKFQHTQILRLYNPTDQDLFVEELELYKKAMTSKVHNYRDKGDYKGDGSEPGKILNFQQLIGFYYLGKKD